MADLLTAEDVGRHMRVSDLAGEKLLLVEDLIDAAQSVIEKIAGRSLDTAEALTEYHTGLVIDNAGCVFVKRPPIGAGTAPTVTDDRRWSERVIDSDDIILDTDDNGDNWAMGKIQLWNNEGYFAGDLFNVKVEYTGGWTTATFPRDLKQAWMNVVQYWYENPERVGVRQQSEGGETVEWAEGAIPLEYIRVFQEYAIMNPGDIS